MAGREVQTGYRIGLFRAVPLLADAAEADLAELARVSRPTAVQRGRPLAKAGAPAEIFIIQSGVVAELYAEADEDRAVLIALHGAHGFVGLADALLRDDAGQPHGRRRYEALSPVSAFALPAADFNRVSRRSPEIADALVQQLARETDSVAHALAASAHRSLEMRLAAFFHRMAALSASDDWNPVINLGRLSQSAVAAMLAVSREHVNRTLAMWERSGVVFQNKQGDILVQDARRLQNLASARLERPGAEKHDDWLWEIDAHLDSGLNQTALHLALEAAKRAPKDSRYAHRAVLATARQGAIPEALALFEKRGLAKEDADEDIASLRPRLLRDLAFASIADKPDSEALAQSAREYEAVFAATKGFYPGVNAAAGFAFAGDMGKAKMIAQAVSQAIAQDPGEDDADNYWRRSTLAECKLLEGDLAAAASLFEAASTAEDATPGKRATTRKQLRRLAPAVNIDAAWIDRAAPQPEVLFFSGPLAHGAAERDLPIAALRNAVDALLASRDIGWAFGALASGADIVIAERLIEAGVSLNVYLPLPPAAFLKSSVHIGGQGWRERFIDCMRAAESIDWNRRVSAPSRAAYRLGALVAMGKTVRRAAELETKTTGFFAVQRASRTGEAGMSLSAANRAQWSARGLSSETVEGDWPVRPAETPADEAPARIFYSLALYSAGRTPAPEWLAEEADIWLRADDAGGVHLALFHEPLGALAAGRRLFETPAGGGFCGWLDAGAAPAAALENGAGETASAFVTALCRPATEPGRLYASDIFASAAPMHPGANARFDYVGFTPTREKVDPCALYLARF